MINKEGVRWVLFFSWLVVFFRTMSPGAITLIAHHLLHYIHTVRGVRRSCRDSKKEQGRMTVCMLQLTC